MAEQELKLMYMKSDFWHSGKVVTCQISLNNLIVRDKLIKVKI